MNQSVRLSDVLMIFRLNNLNDSVKVKRRHPRKAAAFSLISVMSVSEIQIDTDWILYVLKEKRLI